MAKAYLANTSDGRRLQLVPWKKPLEWKKSRNQPDSLKFSVPTYAQEIKDLDLLNTATPSGTSLIITEGDYIMASGSINPPEYDRDSHNLVFTASGVWNELYFRNILPPSAYLANPSAFIMPDPVDPTKTIANPAYATNIAGWDYGTIIKKLIQQTLLAPDGALPITFQADRAGSRSAAYDAVMFKSVGSAITDITALDNGPDVRFTPQWQPDRKGFQYLLETGTEAQPNLRSSALPTWRFSKKTRNTKELKVTWDNTYMARYVWGLGGRSDDRVIMSRSEQAILAGKLPLRELVDSTHSDVVDQAVMQQYTDLIARRAAQGAIQYWSFKVRKDVTPFAGEYLPGDVCKLIIRGDDIIPDSGPGGYLREIAEVSGDGGDWVQVITTPIGLS